MRHILAWYDHTCPSSVRGQVFFSVPSEHRTRLERRGGRWAEAHDAHQAARMALDDARVRHRPCRGGCGAPVAVRTDPLELALYDSEGRCGRCVTDWPPRRDNALVEMLLTARPSGASPPAP